MNHNDWHLNHNILIFDEIDSTFDEAKRIARSDAKGNFIIWANKQLSGNGINGKHWISNAGNLFLSILNKNYNDFLEKAYIPFIIAVSIGQVFTKYINPKSILHYKWPNDIFIDDRKISSIMFDFDQPNLIVGININLFSSPKNLTYKTCCLQDKAGINNIVLEKIIDELMRIINFNRLLCKKNGFKKIRDSWFKNSLSAKKNIIVNTSDARLSGIFENINLKGEVEIRLSNSDLVKIPAYEAFFEKNLFLENFFTI